MKVLIIEDEAYAAAHLLALLRTLPGSLKCTGVIDNLEEAVERLGATPAPDLVFLDIYLADGISFDIFKQVRTDVPIIFTTAYDQYAIRAFEVNSIDYLLKPIRPEPLEKALEKYHRLVSRPPAAPDRHILAELSQLIRGATGYKRNFLVPYKDRLLPVATEAFAWFELRHEVVRGVQFDQAPLVMEEKSLDELADVLDPGQFYRANRQYLVNRKAIREVGYYFNGRLYLNLLPSPPEKVLVSKARSGHFKEWLRSA